MSVNLQNVTLRMTAGNARQFPGDPIPRVALSGRSNVGKSSLINTFLGRKALARVSSSPGKTVTINFYDVDKKFFLVDLPGYGFAARSPEEKRQWSALTDAFFTDNRDIDRLALVLQLIDAKAGITKDDETMLSYLNEIGLPYAIIVTKIDKLNKTDRAAILSSLSQDERIKDGTPILPFSSLKGDGKDDLKKLIFYYIGV